MSTLNIGLTICGRATWQEAEATRKRYQYCTDPSGQEILYVRALQGNSGCSLSDPSSQDNVIIPDGFFKYINHVGCAINLRSIMNSGLITGRTKFEQQRDSILPACGSYEQKYKDPDTIDLEAPRLASTCKKFPIKPTQSEKRSAPFSGNRNTFFY